MSNNAPGIRYHKNFPLLMQIATDIIKLSKTNTKSEPYTRPYGPKNIHSCYNLPVNENMMPIGIFHYLWKFPLISL